ncbi:hypothetical protein NQZ68_008102 [Dissostichus eleginoides]|nr:hypothetical protein NQZ68_008102 [Dissostichus eleginoides]
MHTEIGQPYERTNLHGGSQQQRKRQSAGESARSSEMALFCTFNLSCAPVPRLALCGSPFFTDSWELKDLQPLHGALML